MKFFAFIMAFLVLTLSIMPCADINATPDSKAKTEITKQSKQQDDNHWDACSPFCTCTCCANIACPGGFVKAATGLPPAASVYSGTTTPHLFTIALPIWQPPQLG